MAPGRLASRRLLEQVTEAILNGGALDPRVPPEIRELAHRVLSLDTRPVRLAILGGGTGLSTVVGGNPQLREWSGNPFVGLKEDFPRLDVIVCTTDDGGSTGGLLRRLPMIGIGDLRKSLVALVRRQNLRKRYGMNDEEAAAFALLLREVFGFRYREGMDRKTILADPLLAAQPALRPCPPSFAELLRSLGRFALERLGISEIGSGAHCLGNLLLAAAVFRAAGGRTDRAPAFAAIRNGLRELCESCGVSPGALKPVTSTPGQLRFRYGNGVEVYGQSKSARAHRRFPVECVSADFAARPEIGPGVLRPLRQADLIVYAPGSLYTSIIPILQLEPVAEAIRSNRKALKVLGANLWIQEGETDISPRRGGHGFLVSDLLEAYDRNVPGGSHGLFDVVLAANLERVPGNILRNYTLEGKVPIHLDRRRVEELGCSAVEATLFEPVFHMPDQVIQHHPERFALAVRALYFAWSQSRGMRRALRLPRTSGRRRRLAAAHPRRTAPLCSYLAAIRSALEGKSFRPAKLRDELIECAWENRDIRPAHLQYFGGARVVESGRWKRSTDWDNVLGYFDPEDRQIKLHEDLLEDPVRLRGNLLVALGESLLGRYCESKGWLAGKSPAWSAGRIFEIALRPAAERECFLTDARLRRYLRLARMSQDPSDRRRFRIGVNDDEGFLPPGLLFGMLYAWYLDNTYAGTMEYEMSLLRWPPETLIPYQAEERKRKTALVRFFRTEVFAHPGRNRQGPIPGPDHS